ncbi:hypothetical protein [Klugiella xanthotipulae]|uniref:hypothetical protein n=1 Tax=Klugiella xanthotipulae TaxID=244735 RepID=UPI001476BAF8|nr:hypothetical protein [Klugiella xanthotipulae]
MFSRRVTAENADSARDRTRKTLRFSFRGVFALVLSAGLFGTIVLPAYAGLPSNDEDIALASRTSVQSLMVDSTVIEATVDTDGFAATTGTEIAKIDEANKIEEQRLAAAEAAKQVATNAAAGNSTTGATGDRTNASCAALSLNDTSSFVGSAMAQLGCYQDCTALVENALRAIGYSIGNVGPMGFGGVGTVFSDPSQVQAGDIMMRSGHVSIYLGNGTAIHGGWTDGSTVIAGGAISNPANYSQFVRL